MSMKIMVDNSRCISCGLCTEECHRHLPVNKRDGLESDGVECVGCLHCYAVCPQGAIGIEGLSSNLPFDADSDGAIDEKKLLELLAFRRSTRRFTTQPVHADVVEKLIQSAGYIPSGGNSHSYRFTVITNGETRDRLEVELKKIYALRHRFLKSSMLHKLFAFVSNRQTRAFLLDELYFKRINYILEQYEKGEDPIFYRAPLIIMVHTDTLIPTPGEDAVLAAYNMVLMAQILGLGSCFVTLAQNAINSSRTCKKILNLSSEDQVHAVLAIGHPDVQFHRAIPKEIKKIELFGLLEREEKGNEEHHHPICLGNKQACHPISHNSPVCSKL